MQKHAVITGVTGYTAGQLALHLVNQGWRVTGVKRSASSLHYIETIKDKISLYDYDGDYLSINRLFKKENKVDIVFHLAAYYEERLQNDALKKMIDANILLGSHLAEAMVSNDCFNLINTSTYWQYSDQADKPGDYYPNSYYAATKQAFENILQYYILNRGLRAINLVQYDIYGSGDQRKKLFWLLDRTLKTNESLNMSPGEQNIIPVYIDDVIEAYLQAYRRLDEYPNHIFHIAGKAYSLKDIVAMYENTVGEKLNIHWGALPYRANQIMKPFVGQILPGFTQKVSLEQGMEKIIRPYPIKAAAS